MNSPSTFPGEIEHENNLTLSVLRNELGNIRDDYNKLVQDNKFREFNPEKYEKVSLKDLKEAYDGTNLNEVKDVDFLRNDNKAERKPKLMMADLAGGFMGQYFPGDELLVLPLPYLEGFAGEQNLSTRLLKIGKVHESSDQNSKVLFETLVGPGVKLAPYGAVLPDEIMQAARITVPECHGPKPAMSPLNLSTATREDWEELRKLVEAALERTKKLMQ
jgi:hypothetical protein